MANETKKVRETETVTADDVGEVSAEELTGEPGGTPDGPPATVEEGGDPGQAPPTPEDPPMAEDPNVEAHAGQEQQAGAPPNAEAQDFADGVFTVRGQRWRLLMLSQEQPGLAIAIREGDGLPAQPYVVDING